MNFWLIYSFFQWVIVAVFPLFIYLLGPCCWCTWSYCRTLCMVWGGHINKNISISKIQFISIKIVNSKLFVLYKCKKIFPLIAYKYVAAKSV